MEIFEKEKSDWWDELPSEVQKRIETSIAQSENGNTITHEEVLQKHAPWLAK